MLTFDPATHVYTIEGGKVVPSVTQILQAAGHGSSSFYTPESANKGTFIHAACEALDKGTIDWFQIPAEVIGYVTAYEDFLMNTKFDIRMIEEPLYHSKLKFAGTVDRYGVLNGENFVIDIKSGGKEKWHGLQTAGYALLIEIDTPAYASIPERACLYLKANGKYKLETHDDLRDFEEFRKLLKEYHEKAA